MPNVFFEMYVARRYINSSRSAYSRGINFQLTLDDMRNILSTTHCAYTGIRLTTVPYGSAGGVSQDYKLKDTDLTVERINHEIGYTRDNVVAVCNKVNNLKSAFESCPDKWATFNLEEFIKEACQVMEGGDA